MLKSRCRKTIEKLDRSRNKHEKVGTGVHNSSPIESKNLFVFMQTKIRFKKEAIALSFAGYSKSFCGPHLVHEHVHSWVGILCPQLVKFMVRDLSKNYITVARLQPNFLICLLCSIFWHSTLSYISGLPLSLILAVD
jgi:hypothetical protein